VRFGVLGPVVVNHGDGTVHMGPPRRRAVLAYLLLSRNTLVATDELIDAIWGGAEPATARAQVQMDVSGIRAILRQQGVEQALSGGQGGYRLGVEAGALDLDMFAGHLAAARELSRAKAAGAAAACLREGLALWRGPALADAKAAFVDSARSRLAEQWLAAQELLADVMLEAGMHQELVAELDELVCAHPLRETLVRRLMLALYRCGRRPDALGVAREFRRRLADEQGLDPSREHAQLEFALLRGDAALDLVTGPASVTVGPAPLAQLPADLTTFTGRAAELAELRGAVAAGGPGVPIVVIEGTAGVGKTALALHLVHSIAGQFPDGQLYVDLLTHAPDGPLRPVDAIGILLRAMGVRPEEMPEDLASAAAIYRGFLAGRRLALVLDNAASVDQVRPLLPGVAGCVVVLTSRHDLGGLAARNGAHRMILRALSQNDALLLASRLLGPGCLTHAPAAVEELIALCASLPLALCIAAARIGRTGPGDVRRYVDRLRRDRLDTLAIPDDDACAVRSALGLSYQAVPASTQSYFRMLALVPGQSVPVEAIAAMVDATVPAARAQMATLATAHLVDDLSEERYGFHDLLREYARELACADVDRDAATARLYSWYLNTVLAAAARAYPHMLLLSAPPVPGETLEPFADARSAMAWLDAEYPNLLALIRAGGERGQLPATWRLADALRGYLMRRGHLGEWLAMAGCVMTAAIAAGDRRAQATVHMSLATAYRRSSDYVRVIAHLREAHRLVAREWPTCELLALSNLAALYIETGSLHRARDILTNAIALGDRVADLERCATNRGNLGIVLRELGHTAEAIELTRQVIDRFMEIGSPPWVADGWETLGMALHQQGRSVEALGQLDRALRIYQDLGDHLSEALVRGHLAIVLAACGRLPEAADHAQRALDLSVGARPGRIRADVLSSAADVHLALDDPQTAHRLAHEAHAVALEIGVVKQQITALIARAGAARALGRPQQTVDDATDARDLAVRFGFAPLGEQADRLLAELPLVAIP
jgi:DNA-binding SARP family transcriptional activator/tetratricopeptide (TPR) repeat protein